MLEKNSISNPIELLVYVLLALAFFMILFRISNWLESYQPKERKKKEKKKVEKVVEVKETKIEIDKTTEVKKDVEKVAETKELKSDYVPMPIVTDMKPASNYLYDRFVVSPSKEDVNATNAISESFISENELKEIRDRQVKIRVKNVEDISEISSDKQALYKKIQEMASENVDAKERLLREFESLPREMKLLLIENIMQKM